VLRLLADNNVIGPVKALVHEMQSEPWAGLWAELDLVLQRFEDVGLSPSSNDRQIWLTCQAEQLILITDNRNYDSADSLEGAIRQLNNPSCLPVFTIADLDKYQTNREYAERVVERVYDYLMRIDEVRGTGRLFLP
jgi:hypothetical protein